MTAGPAEPTGSPSRDERWLWVLFAAAWLVHVHFSVIGWENTLVSRFAFRQVQTAAATAYFPTDRFALDYELPLFGPPWSVPLELPVYQASVAWFAHGTGMALDPAGRLVSWLYFQLSLPAAFLLLGSLGLRRPLRWLSLALLVTSPVYLFFSRCFLMESTVFCFSMWFLAGFARWVRGGRVWWLVLASVTGALAATVKPTTLLVFGVGAGLFFLWEWWRQPMERRPRWLAALGRAGLPLVVPALVGLAWQVHSGRVRAANPESHFLDAIYGFFGFGDMAQRLSADFWLRTVGVWASAILSEGGLVLCLVLLGRARRTTRLLVAGTFATFLSAQLVFSNLYYVHDYYFYANGVFLLLAPGLLLADFFADRANSAAVRWALPLLVITLQLVTFSREYLVEQRPNHEVPELARVLADITQPDDTVVILGMDWDATVPYYAHRRALMLISGREADPGSIARTVARLDPAHVGAVVLCGHLRDNATYATTTFAHLNLGPLPMLLSHPLQTGVWVPLDRQAAARDRLSPEGYRDLAVVTPRPAPGEPVVLGRREISRLREFDEMQPRPLRFSSLAGFSDALIAGHHVVNTHAHTVLNFPVRPGARRLTGIFGIQDGAYANPTGRTDGVELRVLNRDPSGRETRIASRVLDPVARREDQGTQQLEIALPAGLAGEIVIQVLPGPRNDSSYDWAYLGEVRQQ